MDLHKRTSVVSTVKESNPPSVVPNSKLVEFVENEMSVISVSAVQEMAEKESKKHDGAVTPVHSKIPFHPTQESRN
jgi:hypothetical protein